MQRVIEAEERERSVAGKHGVVDSAGDVDGFGVVIREELGLLDRDVGHDRLDRLRELAVQILALTCRDRVVHELPQQRVPNAVVAVRGDLHEPACLEPVEGDVDIDVRSEQRPEENDVACASGNGERLEQPALGRIRLIGSAQQKDRKPLGQISHAADVRERRRAVALDDQPGLHHPACRLLEIRWVSTAALDDVVDGRGREGAFGQERLEQRRARRRLERCQPDLQVTAARAPRRCQLRPVGRDDKSGGGLECRREGREHLLRRAIGPLHIRDREDHRLGASDTEDEVADSAVEQLAPCVT